MKIELKKANDVFKLYTDGEFQGNTRYFSYLGASLKSELGTISTIGHQVYRNNKKLG